MAINPSEFHPVNVADTCSVWNILSSLRLYGAAKEANCEFCITSFVRYECLIKARKKYTAAEIELTDRLIKEQSRGGFSTHSCDIGDLQDIKILESRKRLGKGELSSIAFAMKTGQAVITDDQQARKLAEISGHARVQTTPHLFAWLIFRRRLGDSDCVTIIAQHQSMERPLAPHLEAAYSIALQCRLNIEARL